MNSAINQRRRWGFLVLFLVASVLFDHTFNLAQGQIIHGAVSSGMGGAGVAGAEISQTIFLNPAVAVLGKGLNAGFIYRDGYWGRGRHETDFAVSLVENSPDVFAPGGFAYVQRRRTFDGLMSVNEKIVQGALGQFILPTLSFGASVVMANQEVVGGEHYTQWNGTFGLLYVWDTQLGIALVAQNVGQTSAKVPDNLKLLASQTLGVQYLVPNLLRVAFDLTRRDQLNPSHKGIIQAGVEILSAPMWVLRMGGKWDDIEKRNYATLGLGFDGPRLKINYSWTKPTVGANEAMHSVDMDLPF